MSRVGGRGRKRDPDRFSWMGGVGNVSGNSSDPCSESGMKSRQKWVGSSIPSTACVQFWVTGGRPGCLGWAGGRREEGGRDEPTQGLTSLSKEFGLVSKVVGGRDTIGFAVHIYPSFA